MKRGTNYTSTTINCVTYFCEDCGAVSHFAVNHKQKISSIEVEYKSHDMRKGTGQDEGYAYSGALMPAT